MASACIIAGSIVAYWLGLGLSYRVFHGIFGEPNNNAYGWFDNSSRMAMLIFWPLTLPYNLAIYTATPKTKCKPQLKEPPRGHWE